MYWRQFCCATKIPRHVDRRDELWRLWNVGMHKNIMRALSVVCVCVLSVCCVVVITHRAQMRKICVAWERAWNTKLFGLNGMGLRNAVRMWYSCLWFFKWAFCVPFANRILSNYFFMTVQQKIKSTFVNGRTVTLRSRTLSRPTS